MNPFLTMEQVNDLLSDIADEIPSDFFVELHGGVLLEEQAKIHPDSNEGCPLYIMGEYIRSVMGCQIKIYYGSFQKVFGNYSEPKLREELKKTLIHEFTHHLEYRAGLKGLEIKDAENLKNYRSKY